MDSLKLTTMQLSPSTLSVLADASSTINGAMDPDAALHAIAATAVTVMRAEASSVLLLDRRRNELVFKAAIGEHNMSLLGHRFDCEKGIAGRIVATAEPELIHDVRNDPDFVAGYDDQIGQETREMLAAPLISHGDVIGIVQVFNKRDNKRFALEEIELLQVFANLAALGAVGLREGAEAVMAKTKPADAKEAAKPDGNKYDGDKHTIIGQSDALKKVLSLCDRVANSNATVLLLGETGTGKEVMARYLHEASGRNRKPFVAINCAALPETLLESELFGHEKGAFTGAVDRKQGRFEMAEGGTLFLDEIGDISPSTQVKLLRVLQEREFIRVGGTDTITCDVRIIAATNRDLKAAIANGEFREDLFYRLSVFPVQLPPLRERRDDVPLLLDHFSQRATRDLGLGEIRIDEDALAALKAYDWPGNIRELQNVVERAVLLSDDGRILLSQLPGEFQQAVKAQNPDENTLRGQEKSMIISALIEAGWNQSQAARSLGISRDNLRYRIKKYKISRQP